MSIRDREEQPETAQGLSAAVGGLSSADDPFRQAFEQAGVGMLVIDLDGLLLHANRAVCELFGFEREELLGRNLESLKHPEETDLDSDQFQKLATGELSRIQAERRYIHRCGQSLWVQMNAAVVRDAQGQPSYVVGHVHSIDDRRKAESDLRSLNSQLARLASFDGLTGLMNRRTLISGFEQMWLGSDDAGDEVLRYVGAVLQESLRPHHLVGRWGGEEFLMICTNTRADDAFQIAEGIRARIGQKPIVWRDHFLPVTVSLGVAQRTIVCQEPHELIMMADEQLYAAKRMGRNCTCLAACLPDEDSDEDSCQTAVFRPTNM
jgi:PAS domain S-box-containing protein